MADKIIKTFFAGLCSVLLSTSVFAQKPIAGAEQFFRYIPQLAGKKVALVVNQTSVVVNTHLVDTLKKKKVNIVKIFGPEHGFRGKADAGEHVNTDKDSATGVLVVSLYGDNKKPKPEQMQGVDVVVFDIQDVGARFYTFLSTLHYVMEACAEANIPLILLDRPNPNGYYIDGPVLLNKFHSFVGMHPIPIVHGMTLGELAQMINGEKWLKNGIQCQLTVIKVVDYTHKTRYSLPIKPSPNLPNDLSIQMYPSLCLFEGTNMSMGRGTLFPFQVLGYPDKKFGAFTFTPMSIAGMSKKPPYEGQVCYGMDFRNGKQPEGFHIRYLLDAYKKADTAKFFNNFFEKLAGTDQLKLQIKAGKSEEEIRKSWKPGLDIFKEDRKKYLLYTDFE